MPIIKKNGRTYGGGAGGGHTILDDSGVEMEQQEKLQFIGMTVENDSVNGVTVVSATTYIDKPTVTVGTYEYDGTAQGPTITWSASADANYCNITNATATAVGTYTLTISLKNVAKTNWSDATTADLTYTYTIKAPFYLGWLEAGGVTGSYANLSAVLEDEEAIRRLMTMHASVDYLVANASVSELNSIINDDICAKWITLRAYAEDTLSANAAIKAMMDSAGKYGYGEWALMPQVPKMTSDTAPYGVAITNANVAFNKNAYLAFDGDNSTFCDVNKTSVDGFYIGYNFTENKKIRLAKFNLSSYDSHPINSGSTFKVRGSSDGTNWVDCSDSYNFVSYGEYTVPVYSNANYQYYCVWFYNGPFANGSNYYAYIISMQFYAWAPKGNVPVMTGASAPYGETIENNHYGSNYAYYAFNNDASNYWHAPLNTSNSYVGYKFTNPVCVRKTRLIIAGNGLKKYKIQGSNDGFVSDINDLFTSDAVGSTTAGNKYILEDSFSNNAYYLYYRLLVVESWQNDGTAYVNELQFYGRELKVSVPKMTANDAPWGEAMADSNYGSDYPYKAFDDDDDLSWSSNQINSASNIWVGYKFPFPVVVKKAQIAFFKYQGSTSYITSNSYKIQGSNDRFVNDIHDLSVVYTGTDDRSIDLDNDTAYLYYRVLIISQTISASGWVCGRVVHLNFFGMNYGEYDWDADNPRHYLYDHGVEPNEQVKVSHGTNGSAEKRNYDFKVATTSGNGFTNYGYVYSYKDLSDYSLLRAVSGLEGVPDSSEHLYGGIWVSTQEFNGSSYDNSAYVARITIPSPIADKYNVNMDISSINDAYWFGPLIGYYQNSAMTYEELWLE